MAKIWPSFLLVNFFTHIKRASRSILNISMHTLLKLKTIHIIMQSIHNHINESLNIIHLDGAIYGSTPQKSYFISNSQIEAIYILDK